jgi:2-oxoisovalerate dehydrogenase E1 component
MTAGEVSEALHMAELLQAPIAFVVQDNGFSISAKRHDIWRDDVAARMAGYPGIALFHADGRDFEDCYRQAAACLALVREERRPAMLIAQVPLLGHHTSGIRSGYYRDPEELRQAREQDPFLRLEALLLSQGLAPEQLAQWREEGRKAVETAFARAKALPEPLPQRQEAAVFAPTPVREERGSRTPEGRKPSFMVDAGRAAIDELLEAHPEAVYMGQDVGHLGGIFREAYGLQRKYGPARVRSMPIQEAYTIGAAAGLSAVGCRPIVSVPFADYLWAGLNQLRNELSPAYFLSQGKWPAGAVIRVPVGAYGGGGPYHSASIESALLQIKGLKVAYPSNGADLKGLLKAAFHDGNPVAILEHKGLYWAKTPLTKASMRPEPEADYVLPLGKACVAVEADAAWVEQGKSVVAIAYGMGVHWAAEAAKRLGGRVAVVDLRSLHPLDEALLEEQVRRHGKALVITEEPVSHSFAEALAGKLMRRCFEALDAPIEVLGALNLPAIPLNMALEADMLPSADKVELALRGLLEA